MHDAAIYHLVLILHTIDNDGHISRQSAAVQLAVYTHKVDLVQDETTQCPLAALLPFQNHPQLQ